MFMSNAIVTFVNWTDEEFVGKWDGKKYKFKPGETRYMEAWKANHFAKHLTDRELHKMGKLTTDQRRQGLLDKCVIVNEDLEEVDESMAEEEALNLEMKKSEEVEEKLEEEIKEEEEVKPEVVEETEEAAAFEELKEEETPKEEVAEEEKPKRGRPKKVEE